MTWAIAELLGRHAGRVTVSNPLRTKAIASAKVKTDRVDAKVLAQLAAADFLPAVWAPDEQTRALRRRVSHRASLVRQRTRLRNQVHAVLARNLVEVPVTDLFGQKGRRWLVGVELPGHEREQLESNLRLHDALDRELTAADGQLAQRALADAEVRRLMTIPGIGPVTALSLLAVIGDVTRFPSAGQLVGYLGLDPRVRQSGERPARTGHISRAGQAHVARAARRSRPRGDPDTGTAARLPCARQGQARRASRALRYRAQARRAQLAPAQQRRGLPLQRPDGHGAQTPATTAASRRPGPQDQPRRRDETARARAATARGGRTQLPRPRRRTHTKRRGRHHRGKRLLLALEGQTMHGRPDSPHGLLFSTGSPAPGAILTPRP
jgi:transposase